MTVTLEKPATTVAPWQQIANLADAFDYPSWLALQCGLINGVYAGLLVSASTDKSLQPVAVWPEANDDVHSLTDLVEQVLDDGDALVTELAGRGRSFGVAYPVKVDAAIVAVVAIAVSVGSDAELPDVMHELRWGAAWIELRQTRELYRSREQTVNRLSTSVDLLARVLPEQGFDQAAMRLVTELAITLNSDLVSIGFVQQQRVQQQGVKLAHLSHSAEFGSHMNLVRSLENAMDEALDQRSAIVLPAVGPTANLVTVAHHCLAELQQHQAIMTVPLVVGEQWLGAITLQRDLEQPYTQADLDYCESILALAVSALDEKRHNDRPLRQKIGDELITQIVRLTGPGYVGRKLTLGLTALAVLVLTFLQGDYRLSTDATLQPVSQRVIVAPFDGYIKAAQVRAGDVVAQGDTMFELDDRDLQLEKLKWRSQQNKLSRQYQEAIASHDRSNITILNAQLEQAQAQLDLVDSQLQRSTQLAPFNGLIVSGDLSQRLGGAVSHGETLFEVSPADAYRLKMLVKESRIADLQPGQSGTVYLSALPEHAFPFTVDNITPVTEFSDGATYFVVEASLQTSADALNQEKLRPGMEGVGKVYIDRRNQFGIWTRELVEWLRLRFWRWWG